MTFDQQPTALPYRGTTGSSGSKSSRDRAEREAADGTASARQKTILGRLAGAGVTGMTSQEMRAATGEHHGKVSGALSSMHKEGLVVALAHEHNREGHTVYVRPQHVVGRLVRPFRSQSRPVAAPSRPHLSEDEKTLVSSLRARVNSGGDTPITLRVSTARTLLAAIDRLERG